MSDTAAEAATRPSPSLEYTPPAILASRPRLTTFRVFALTLAGYMCFFGGHYVSGDNAQRVAWAKALLHGNNDISATFPGLHFTKYGIGTSLLHIPFLLAAGAIKRMTGISCEGPIGMLLYELNAALGLSLIFSILVGRCRVKPSDAFLRTAVLGFCTVWFPYSKLDYSETLAAVALLGALRFAESRPWIAGLFGSLAIMLRSESILWFAITILFATRDWRSLLRIAIGAAPGIMITLWANFARTGNILNSGYEVDFSEPLLAGIYGLLFSAGKGALFFTPLIFLYPPAIADLWHSSNGRGLAGLSLTLVAAQLCFYGKWWDWSGEDSWGPRLIVYAMLVALIVIAAAEVSRTRFFAVAAIVGFFLQLPPVLIGPHTSIMIDRTRSVTNAGGSMGTVLPLTLDDVHFVPAYSQITNTANLLLLKIAPHAPALRQTQWMRGINPPLDIHDVPIDLFWINPPRRHQ